MDFRSNEKWIDLGFVVFTHVDYPPRVEDGYMLVMLPTRQLSVREEKSSEMIFMSGLLAEEGSDKWPIWKDDFLERMGSIEHGYMFPSAAENLTKRSAVVNEHIEVATGAWCWQAICKNVEELRCAITSILDIVMGIGKPDALWQQVGNTKSVIQTCCPPGRKSFKKCWRMAIQANGGCNGRCLNMFNDLMKDFTCVSFDGAFAYDEEKVNLSKCPCALKSDEECQKKMEERDQKMVEQFCKAQSKMSSSSSPNSGASSTSPLFGRHKRGFSAVEKDQETEDAEAEE